MLDYYMILLLCFLGLICGFFLNRIAWDEVKQYKIYIQMIEAFSAISIFFLALYYSHTFLAGILSLVFVVFHVKKKQHISYAILAMFLWMTYYTDVMPYVASLILLYSFPYASLTLYSRNWKEYKHMQKFLSENSLFLLFGVILGVFL